MDYSDLPKKIAYLGSGMFGQAIATVLAQHNLKGNFIQHCLWNRNPETIQQLTESMKYRTHTAEKALIDFERIPQKAFNFCSGYSGTHSFDDCIDGADLIIIGASSIGNYEISQNLANKDIPKDIPIVILSKGIVEHKKRLYLPSEAMELFLRNNPIAMLSGLMFAEEIFENADTFANIALNYANSVKKRLDRKKMYEYLRRIFNIGHLTTFKYDNILWVETGGAAKNVYGIASGYTNKMLHLRRKQSGKHDEDLYLNTLLSLAMYTGLEMQTIYNKLRSKERNPRDIMIRTHVFTNRSIPAWDSDRYGTLIGRKSRNFRYGEFKAEGKPDQDPQIKKLGTIEGINTAKQLIRMFNEDEKREDVPLLAGVNEWLAGKVTAEQIEKDLITYLRNVEGSKGSRRYVARVIKQIKQDPKK